MGGERGIVTENRGIAFQSQDGEESPGRVCAGKKVKDQPGSFRQPRINKVKVRSPRKGSGLEDRVLDAEQRKGQEKEWSCVT